MRRATVYLSLHEEPNGEGGGVGLYKVGHGGGGGGAVISSQQSQTVLNRSRRLTWSHQLESGQVKVESVMGEM